MRRKKASFDADQFRELLSAFRALNPDQIEDIEEQLNAYKPCPEAFEILCETAEDVLKLYLNSPVKRAEQAGLQQYYYFLNKTSKRLLKQGEMPQQTPVSSSMALVPALYYTPLQWIHLKSETDMPDAIATAMDASQRRNELVRSVLEPLFRIMLRFDQNAAIKWQLRHAGNSNEPVDPDIARDIIRSWKDLDTLPEDALRKVVEWASDEMAVRHWPAVITEADALLRRRALIAWRESDESNPVESLRRRYPFQDDDKLVRWLITCLGTMGKSIDFFCKQAEAISAEAEPEDWRRDAIFSELLRISSMINPLLILSDLLLSRPDGSRMFAMAVFGFTTQYKEAWYSRLVEQCRKAVRKCFLRDLRLKRKPKQTIHTLSFGNVDFEEQLIKELDVFTETFDSIQQREVVTDRLAHMYASYREESLLAQELGVRYRRMMRLLHEDVLARVLTKEQFEEAQKMSDLLVHLSSIAAQSRRFMSMRRALDKDTGEIISADMEYRNEIRALRTSYIRRALRI